PAPRRFARRREGPRRARPAGERARRRAGRGRIPNPAPLTMLIPYAWLVPHLPTLVIDEHRGHLGGMVQAMRVASERLAAEQPAVIVALSARWRTPGPFLVDTGRRHPTLTDYSGFGVEVRYDCAGHPKLGKALVEAARKAKARVGAATRGLDSGLAVPLHFM